MAKKIGLLQADEPLKLAASDCTEFVSKSVARYLVRKLLARRVAPCVIQMVKITAVNIQETISAWFDGPLGVGNLLPFSKPQSTGDKLHYEIPMAGDRGTFAQHRRPFIRVSARNGRRYLEATAMQAATNFASRLLAG